ncbi:MAG TPA: hypothetical protein VM370_12800 [Candidatus Thermoplasmatota archaeon]|nr:hypothetical protein [Candidatus Thermoplasmatota archaeon]
MTPYIEEAVAYDGGVAATWLREHHTFRSWTNTRMVAHRDMAWTGAPGFEIVTIDATNASTTWLLTLDYQLVSHCVDDRAADDAKACEHWSEVADVTVASFDAAGGWSAANGAGSCDAQGGR